MPVIDQRPTVALNKIMYATDFSPFADRAGRYAKGLAQRFGSTVEIAHVFQCYEDTSETEKDRERRELLMKSLEEFRAAGVKTCFAQSSECPVPTALLLMERQFGPDLIVIGTRSRSTLDRFLIGSTAEHLIRNAGSAVLTVGRNAKPPKEGPLTFEKIVFAADYSGTSNLARNFALAFAQEAGAHLWICHIAGRSSNGMKTPAHSEEHDFRRELERLIPPEAYDWCSPECAVQYGNPAQEILELARRVNADLIVMGARARSFWLSHVRRGVTQDVLAQATCPVLTVH